MSWATVLHYSVSVFDALRQKLNFMQVGPNTEYSLVEELPDLQDQEAKTNNWKLFYLSDLQLSEGL